MQILLQHTGGKPIYEQIAEQMKAQILSGEIPAGEQLPSIRTLAKDLHSSVITTKRAYEELEDRFPDIFFVRCYMDPIMQKHGLTPDWRFCCNMKMSHGTTRAR